MQLPKQYDHRAAQQTWYPFWESHGWFHSEPQADREPFTIVIPPPNVTGALHLGHALNNTLQDILVRFKRMQGYNTLWLPGTDHAGIATQAVVERRLLHEEGRTRHDLGRDALVARIWKWKDEYEARILGQLKQMGCSCDWQRTRFTLDEVCARAVRHTFFDFFRAGLIYRGQRLVNWDTHLQTAVADDEIFHETVPGHFWTFRYPIEGTDEFIRFSTTRPETMLGDTAVAVHPDDARYQHLVGRRARIPLVDRTVPIIADPLLVDPTLGTGAVKVTPAHDPNDYQCGLRHGLPMINILRPDGTINEHGGRYAGLDRYEARRRVVEEMQRLGLFDGVEDRDIDLAHSDRSKTPIEPLLSDQWFVRMGDRTDGPGLAQLAMDAVASGRVRIVPPRYAKTYLDWLGEKRDWCISRQLWWGHRIPIWYAPAETAEDELRRAFAGRDDIAWTRDESSGQWLICARDVDLAADALPGRMLTQDPDVLDTWFSSALWPHSTLGWPDDTPELRYYYPTSALITSRDIITLWVARMVLTGLYNTGDVPFREVYIHPKILDAYGETMSKSKGNGVDPLDVIDRYGADALRFGLAYLTTETQDARMPVEFVCPHCQATIEQTRDNRVLPRVDCGQCQRPFATQWAEKPEDLALPRGAVTSERFELGRNFCNKLWNAARFALLNLEGYTAAPVDDAHLAVEDRWLLSRLATVTHEVTQSLEHYGYAEAARTLYGFAWDEFCSFYLEMLKHRLADPQARGVAQRTLAHALDVLLRLLHPMIPFLTEDVWQRLARVAPQRGLDDPQPAAPGIIIAPWPRPELARQDRRIEEQFALFQELLRGLRDIRARQNIPVKATVHFCVRCEPQVAALLQPMVPYFAGMAAAQGAGW